MLKDYWPAYQNCPDCGKRWANKKAYFKCKDLDCGYIDKAYLVFAKRKKLVEGKIKEISTYLLRNDKDYNGILPQYNFPTTAFEIYGINAGGWYDPETHSINIPQKALYLKNSDIVETTAHESAHVTCEPFVPEGDTTNGHIEKWHYKYMEYRKQAFGQFSSFAYARDKDAQYTINLNKRDYKEQYKFDLEDLKYDPYEDD